MLVELCSPWLSDRNLFVLIIELWLSYARRGLVIEFCVQLLLIQLVSNRITRLGM